jgi:hypothetical protein
VRCEASGVLVAKDKAIKRFIVRNIVDASAIRDIQDASVIDGACMGDTAQPDSWRGSGVGRTTAPEHAQKWPRAAPAQHMGQC